MTEWLTYLLLAGTCAAGYWLLGYVTRKTYNRARASEGRHR